MTRVLQGSTVLSTALGRHDPDFINCFFVLFALPAAVPPPAARLSRSLKSFFIKSSLLRV